MNKYGARLAVNPVPGALALRYGAGPEPYRYRALIIPCKYGMVLMTMKQKPLLIANWKMNLLPHQEEDLAKRFRREFSRYSKSIEIVLCPSHLGLALTASGLKNSSLRLGTQDAGVGSPGAFTGEVSVAALRELSVKYCIVGHSERRHRLQETDEMINGKVLSVLVEGLTPVLCVGESSDERAEGKKEIVVLQQLERALRNVSGEIPMVITYEPIWAISPGGPASPEEVGPMVALIHQTLLDHFSAALVEKNFRIIYGGSVDGGNLGQFLALENVSGALVGAASLVTERFREIIQSAVNAK